MFKQIDGYMGAKVSKEDIEAMKKDKLYVIDAIINNKEKWDFGELENLWLKCGSRAFIAIQRTQDTRPFKQVVCWSNIEPDTVLVTR